KDGECQGFAGHHQGHAGLRLPEPHAPIGAAGGEGASIGTEGHAPDAAVMAAERADLSARGDIPQLDEAVLAGRRNRAAVGTKRQAPDAVLVTPEDAPGAAGSDLPDAGGLVPIAARGGQERAVGAEGHGVDGPGVAPQHPNLPAGAPLPEAD